MDGRFLTKTLSIATHFNVAELSEVEAIRLAQQGDERGFERIYRLHSQRVYALCLRMMRGNAAEAEDLTQESFSGILHAVIPQNKHFPRRSSIFHLATSAGLQRRFNAAT
jgi:DNA-directed RNA polymerase specialized sigma24 family protein